MENWKHIKQITKSEQFVVGKYYAILDSSTMRQVDCFLCNNIDSASITLEFYKGKCLIVEHLTIEQIRKAIDNLRNENNAQYWIFVRSAHSKSSAPLMRCVELQRERGALEKWLESKLKLRKGI